MYFIWDDVKSTINKKTNNNASSDFIKNKQESKTFQGICLVRRRFIKTNIYHNKENQHLKFDTECLKKIKIYFKAVASDTQQSYFRKLQMN